MTRNEKLFDFFSEEHDMTLTDGQINDIINEVEKNKEDSNSNSQNEILSKKDILNHLRDRIDEELDHLPFFGYSVGPEAVELGNKILISIEILEDMIDDEDSFNT